MTIERMAHRFSIVVPVYQNEEELPDTITKLLSLRDDLPGYMVDLVFVEDGSRDRSLDILLDYAQRYPENVRVVKLSRNFGQTPAIQAGLQYAMGDCVGIISADLQEPWECFPRMIREWERSAKFVIGERQTREESPSHQLFSGIYWNLVRLAFRDFPRMGYDFCLIDRQVVDDINHINEKNSSIFVLIYWLGYRPVRVPIVRRLREVGKSQWRFWKKVSFTVDTLIGFTNLPARLITVMSFTLAVLCLLFLFFSLMIWLQLRSAPPGWMTQVALLTLLGSMILFALGIVSEYLLRILDETRQRPPYVVDRVVNKANSPPQG